MRQMVALLGQWKNGNFYQGDGIHRPANRSHWRHKRQGHSPLLF